MLHWGYNLLSTIPECKHRMNKLTWKCVECTITTGIFTLALSTLKCVLSTTQPISTRSLLTKQHKAFLTQACTYNLSLVLPSKCLLITRSKSLMTWAWTSAPLSFMAISTKTTFACTKQGRRGPTHLDLCASGKCHFWCQLKLLETSWQMALWDWPLATKRAHWFTSFTTKVKLKTL